MLKGRNPVRESEISYYVLIASDIRTERGIIPSSVAIPERVTRGYWALGENTALRKRFRSGDRVVFYAAGRGGSTFLGAAVLASASIQHSVFQREEFEYEYDYLLGAGYGVWLEDVVMFSNPVPARSILDRLSFVGPRRDNWGVYFHGGAKRISEEDYNQIISLGLGHNNTDETE